MAHKPTIPTKAELDLLLVAAELLFKKEASYAPANLQHAARVKFKEQYAEFVNRLPS